MHVCTQVRTWRLGGSWQFTSQATSTSVGATSSYTWVDALILTFFNILVPKPHGPLSRDGLKALLQAQGCGLHGPGNDAPCGGAVLPRLLGFLGKELHSSYNTKDTVFFTT